MTREQYLEIKGMLTTDIAWMLETWGYDTDDWGEIIMDEIDLRRLRRVEVFESAARCLVRMNKLIDQRGDKEGEVRYLRSING